MKGVSLINVAVFAIVFLGTSHSASWAGWLDKIKDRAADAVEDAVQEEVQNSTHEAAGQNEDSASQSASGQDSSASSGQANPKPVVPSGETYAETYGSTTYLVSIWPHDGVEGNPVRDVEIRGVRLGQPLPQAEKALVKNGFSKVNGLRYQRMLYEIDGKRAELSRADYHNLPPEKRGNIIRSIVVELTATTPSDAIAAELPPYPEEKAAESGLSADESKRCDQMNSRDRRWAEGLSRSEIGALRQKCRAARQTGQAGKPQRKFVSGIWFGQKSISGENVNPDAFIKRAKETFGEPTYSRVANTQHAGAAFNGRGMMWYVDSALVPKGTIRKYLEKCGDDDRPMVFRDFMHPGDASNAYYLRAYENSFDDMVEALRIAYAPHMAIGFQAGAFVVDAQWPFLDVERSYRTMWEKEKAREAQPDADIAF